MNLKGFFYIALTLFLFSFDRLTKFFAVKILSVRSCDFFFIHFTLVKNLGGAWGIFSGQTYFFIFVGSIFLLSCIILWFKSPNLRISLSFLIAGVSSNLLDRVLGSHQVIDFIDIHILPVFNLSDVYIDIGILLLIFYNLNNSKKQDRL
ncbi:signal peptidase II [Thermodesulfobium acidiphilum]|uniref:Lipoprotein signal peptidase n=1 Tax=Thermodesulfobium acidiphilum TaxID=1794699 RepID=A0A2R4W131_THEAF|nr:signal peptidase II [Thermodesulfobium acidiphilum]